MITRRDLLKSILLAPLAGTAAKSIFARSPEPPITDTPVCQVPDLEHMEWQPVVESVPIKDVYGYEVARVETTTWKLVPKMVRNGRTG